MDESKDDDLNEEIDRFVDKLAEDAVACHKADALLPRDQLKVKLKEEYRKEILAEEVTKELEEAVQWVLSEGARYLDETELANLQDRLQMASRQTGEYVQVSDEAFASIEKMALATFEERDYYGAALLYRLLYTLDPEFFFLLRLGIVWQEAGELAKACAIYEKAALLDPNQMLPHLFSAECHILAGSKDQAKIELERAKTCQESTDPMWKDYLTYLESLID